MLSFLKCQNDLCVPSLAHGALVFVSQASIMQLVWLFLPFEGSQSDQFNYN
jgi:hypothetical protein